MRMSVRLVVLFHLYINKVLYTRRWRVGPSALCQHHSYTALLYAPSKKRDSLPRASVFFLSFFLAHATIFALDTIHIFYRSHSHQFSFWSSSSLSF